jgi:hypothetical protein
MKIMQLAKILLLVVGIGVFPLASLAGTELKAAVVIQSDYCKGWDYGWQEGWKYVKGNVIPPMSPMCPMAELNKDRYQDGYNRGFVAGQRAAQK